MRDILREKRVCLVLQVFQNKKDQVRCSLSFHLENIVLLYFRFIKDKIFYTGFFSMCSTVGWITMFLFHYLLYWCLRRPQIV